MFDHRIFAVEVASVVKEFTAQAVAPLLSRIDALERQMQAPPPINIAGLVIDRNGDLVATLSDGQQRSLGAIVGKDGAAGAPGIGFDDLAVEYDGQRTLTLKFVRDTEIKAFTFVMPIVLYRGVFKGGQQYLQGDSVTWGGSQFIALRDTSDAPETSDAWQLAVQRGREGKPGKHGKDGAAGIEGRPGRDLTQLGHDGRKW